MLSESDALALVNDQLLPAHRTERERLDVIDLWYRWQQEDLRAPKGATEEHKRLIELAKTPWLFLVVTTIAQAMFVDGYRSPESADMASPWRTWNANDFDTRQTAIHRAALAYGYAFVTVTPGVDAVGPRSVLRGVSPRKMFAAYEDPAEDDWPLYALRLVNDKTIRLFDDEAVHTLRQEDGKWLHKGAAAHGAGVCPVVRYSNMLDLDGRATGEVEPFIGVASRINKTSYDRLLTQHFNSWKVRTIAGLTAPETESEEQQKKIQLRQDDLLVAEDPDTKFGTLDETPLEGFIRSWESDIEALAATSQTPSHNLTGKMVNLSAEALAAARAPLTQKVYERQTSFGKSHTQALRLAAHLEGDEDAANDVMARVTWQDMEIRSMAQAVDALGKAAQMLGVPVQALWSRIPGVTKSDVDEWRSIQASSDPMLTFNATLEQQAADVGL